MNGLNVCLSPDECGAHVLKESILCTNMYCNVKGSLEYMLVIAQMCKLPLYFLFPDLPCILSVQVPSTPPGFSCYSCGVRVESDMGVHVIFVCSNSCFFFSFLVYIYMIIYITHECVYTFERLCWLPGGVFCPFFPQVDLSGG